jgi:hypothetical protein
MVRREEDAVWGSDARSSGKEEGTSCGGWEGALLDKSWTTSTAGPPGPGGGEGEAKGRRRKQEEWDGRGTAPVL